MKGRQPLATLPVCLLLVACAGAVPATPTQTPMQPPAATPTPTAAPTATQTASPIPTARPTVAVTAPPQPSPMPSAAAATFEPAEEAPEGAITIVLTDSPPDGAGPAFLPKSLTTEAGQVVFFLHNKPNVFNVPHNFRLGPEIGQTLASSPTLNANQSGLLTVADLAPGRYAYWCTFGDHYQFGMTGTLTVEQ